MSLQPGARGWIAYDGEYVIEVEFVGYEAGGLDRAYPSLPTVYYRLLEDISTKHEAAYAGEIVSETQRLGDESVLHPAREDAVREALKYVEYWAKRKRDEDDARDTKAAKLRAELAASGSGRRD